MSINNIKPSGNLHHRIRGILLFALMMIMFATAQEKKQPAFVEDFLKVYGAATEKATSLAEAIPAEKYDWRPAEGVRSIKESVVHIAGGNYFFASLLGTPVPEGINPRDLEKTVESKEKAISTLRESVAHMKGAIANMKEEAFNEEVEFFGNKMTRRQVTLVVGDHTAEHLGQLIAYARMNGIVPPWSQKDN
jgi:uncharacterized damage-inducible protein DinB